ncbi:MAG: two-component system sensor histidine kinase NtrB [Deferrisomatales bacterium]
MTVSRPAGADELQRAIALFEETTARLRDSYGGLQGEVRELQARLDHSRAERDRLAGYLEHLLASVPTGVVAVAPDGRLTTLNRAAQEITGLSADAAGQPFGQVFSFEGSPTPPTLEELEGRPRPVVTLRRPDGEPVLLGLRVSPFRGEGGEVLGRVVVFQDVTRLKRLEEHESRNRRLVAMGEMAAGIAHEIRNPLGSLELFATHLVDELRGQPHEELAGHVLKGIQNLSRISGNLLLFARKVEPVRAPADLGEVVREALLYARAALRAKGAALEEAIGPAPVEADADLLRQALLNLLLNAVQAVGPGGRIRVGCALRAEERPPLAVATVEDDGPGVPPEGAERIFDPFYTTRASGVGLGLAIVQRIVAAHGGWVTVGRSALGGAEFTVGVPAGPASGG